MINKIFSNSLVADSTSIVTIISIDTKEVKFFMEGKMIKEIIHKRGLKQKYIVEEVLGISPVTLNYFLNGKKSMSKSKYYRLTGFLGVDA